MLKHGSTCQTHELTSGRYRVPPRTPRRQASPFSPSLSLPLPPFQAIRRHLRGHLRPPTSASTALGNRVDAHQPAQNITGHDRRCRARIGWRGPRMATKLRWQGRKSIALMRGVHPWWQLGSRSFEEAWHWWLPSRTCSIPIP